jgi:hypothetical protein
MTWVYLFLLKDDVPVIAGVTRLSASRLRRHEASRFMCGNDES